MAQGLQNAAATFRASHDSFAAAARAMLECATYAEQFADLVQNDGGSGGKRKANVVDEGETITNGKRKRATKKKDPNAPKRPASSYLIYQNEVRKELKERHPDLNNTELLHLIKTQWSDMSEEKKTVYQDKMAKAKERYNAEKDAYDARSPEEVARADAEVAAALAAKQAAGRKRKPKAEKAAVPISAPVVATSSESEDDEDEEPAVAVAATPATDSSESSEEEEDDDDEEEEIVPPPKKAKTTAAPPPVVVEKDKKKKRAGKA
ncbi:high mobility group box domain-containing protein [Mycena amicta]|nr:high mobility group box domain-containing protein [Mycena amicta]